MYFAVVSKSPLKLFTLCRQIYTNYVVVYNYKYLWICDDMWYVQKHFDTVIPWSNGSVHKVGDRTRVPGM